MAEEKKRQIEEENFIINKEKQELEKLRESLKQQKDKNAKEYNETKKQLDNKFEQRFSDKKSPRKDGDDAAAEYLQQKKQAHELQQKYKMELQNQMKEELDRKKKEKDEFKEPIQGFKFDDEMWEKKRQEEAKKTIEALANDVKRKQNEKLNSPEKEDKKLVQSIQKQYEIENDLHKKAYIEHKQKAKKDIDSYQLQKAEKTKKEKELKEQQLKQQKAQAELNRKMYVEEKQKAKEMHKQFNSFLENQINQRKEQVASEKKSFGSWASSEQPAIEPEVVQCECCKAPVGYKASN